MSIREEVDAAIPRLKEIVAIYKAGGDIPNGELDRDIALPFVTVMEAKPLGPENVADNVTWSIAFQDAMSADEQLVILLALHAFRESMASLIDAFQQSMTPSPGQVFGYGQKHAAGMH